MKTTTYALFGLVLFLFSYHVQAATTVYKWKDANGQMHYSDRPPPDAQAESLTVKNPPRQRVPAPVTDADTQDENETEQKSPQEPPAMSEEQKAAKAALKRQQEEQKKIIRKKNCGIARRNLKTLKSTVRVRKLDPKTGDYVRVSDNERLKKLREYQRKVREYCR